MPKYYTLIAATDTAEEHAADTDEHSAVDSHEATGDSHGTATTTHETAAHTTEDSHGESESGAAVLGIDPLAIALQAGTFLILFVIIRKFALAKIVANLDERRETISEGLKNAEDIEIQKAEVIKKNEQALTDARKKADGIIDKSHEEAGTIIAEAQARASQQGEEIVAKAKAQAEAEADKVRKELKSEMLGLITEATEVILDEKMTDAKDQKIISNALQQGASS